MKTLYARFIHWLIRPALQGAVKARLDDRRFRSDPQGGVEGLSVQDKPRIPGRFQVALVRCVTPVDDMHRELGIEFGCADGSRSAVRLSVDQAESLSTVLDWYLRAHRARLQDHPAPPPNEEWRIQIKGEQFQFYRYINGKVNEAYRLVDQPEAAVWAAAIIQGFEPPRRLVDSDRPAG